MNRRKYLTVTATVATVSLAGCTSGGGEDAIVSGSTDFEQTWEKEIESGLQLELEVSLNEGMLALGHVSQIGGDTLAEIEIEEEGETETKQFETPETADYFIVLQASGEESRTGDASLTLREVD